ncbi:MAG: hypothetical protein K1Y36_29825 [Blastocatellia bacterium]|nr:hypothetical protein [Blastocatellia bacterium]
MNESGHLIRKQTLQVEVTSEALALVVQACLSDLNRNRLLPVIEAVLDEICPPGQVISIPRLELDLGRMGVQQLTELAPERLKRELRQALTEVLRQTPGGTPPQVRFVSEGAARRERLERFLETGSWPFSTVEKGAFSGAGLLLDMAATDPEGLTRMLHQLGHKPHALERLVLHLNEGLVRKLLEVLEPKHAALIVLYLADLKGVQREEPLVRLTEQRFEQVVWFLSLAYLLQDPGTQFNRLSFVQSLLEGLAESEGISYPELLKTFWQAVRRTRGRLPVQSSLPAILEELAKEADVEEVGPIPGLQPERISAEPGQRLAEYLQNGFWPVAHPTRPGQSVAAAMLQLAATHPEQLAALLRRHGQQGFVLERLLLLGETVLRHVLEALQPEHAALMVAFLLDLQTLHRMRPLINLEAHRFSALLWFLTLAYVVKDPGSQFNRKSYVRSILEEVGEAEGVQYASLLAALQSGLQETGKHHPLRSSLPAVLHELTAELNRVAVSPELPAPGMVPDSWPELALSWIGAYLTTGILSTPPWPSQVHSHDLNSVFAILARHHHPRVRTLLHQLASTGPPTLETLVARLLAIIGPREVLRLALRTIPATLSQRLEAQAATGLGPPERVLAPAFEFLLQQDATGWNEATLIRQTLALVTKHAGGMVSPDVDWSDRFPAGLGGPLFANETGGILVNRYEQLEIIRYLLDWGLLPWKVQWETSELTPSLMLRAMLNWPLARLLQVLEPEQPKGLENRLFHLVTHLDQHDLNRLLSRLAPAMPGDSPFWEAVVQAATASARPTEFWVGLLGLMLAGEDLDLEQVAQLMGGNPLLPVLDSIPFSQWDAHLFQAVLVSRYLRQEPNPTAGALTDTLLQTYFRRYPGDAGHFLNLLGPAPHQFHSLVESCSTETYSLWLGLFLQPAGVAALLRLETLWSEAGSRAGERSLVDFREICLREIWDAARGGRSSSQALEQVFLRLWGTSEPTEIARETARILASAELLPPAETRPDAGRLAALRLVFGAEVFPSHSSWAGSEATGWDMLKTLLDQSPEAVTPHLWQHLGDATQRERWVKTLPESVLLRLGMLLEPRKHRILLDSAEALAAGWRQAVPVSSARLLNRTSFWSFWFDFLARVPAQRRSVERLTEMFFELAGQLLKTAGIISPKDETTARTLISETAKVARNAGLNTLPLILLHRRDILLAAWRSGTADPVNAPAETSRKPAPSRPHKRKTTFRLGDEEEEISAKDPIYLSNAGLILASPFLPQLWNRLEVLETDATGKPKMRDWEAASRAVHLLQFLVDGTTDTPEPCLVLNKLLCGLPMGARIATAIELTDLERETCEGLLLSLIANWEAIRNTSIAGLRETFLQREGKLEKHPDRWQLHIRRKTLDILVDQIPWSIKVIFHRWMPVPLYVTW